MRGVWSSIVTSLFSTTSTTDSGSYSDFISQFIQETLSLLKDYEIEDESTSAVSTLIQHMQANPSLYLLLLLLLVIGSITTSSSNSKNHNGTTEAFREWIIQNMKNIPKQTAAIVARRSSFSDSSSNSNSNSPNDENSDNSKRNRIVSPANLESLKESFQWWEDLAPPFAFRDTDPEHEDDEEDFDDHDNDETDHQHSRGRSREQQLDLRQFFSSSTSRGQQEQQHQASKRPLSPSSTASASSFSSSASNTPASAASAPPDVLHFCFLVHGHRGFSQDLSYMQTVMQRTVNSQKRKEKRKRRRRQQPNHSGGRSSSPEKDTSSDEVTRCSTTDTQNTDSTTATTATTMTTVGASASRMTTATSRPKQQSQDDGNPFAHQDMVVHAVVCNERKTDDGVAAGGERLVQEIKSVIAKHRRPSSSSQGADDNNNELQDITISFVGNSLGGLYSRYAVAKLVEQCQAEHDSNDDSDCLILDGRYRVHFNVFCTTATPHLGVASHTFLPIPRTAEIGVAHAMGSTGKDLFRLNDLIHDMATSSHFLQPLSAFRKRIAYANAYGTDFPVPAQTAAFLNQDSSYPHYFAESSGSNGEQTESSSSLVSETGESLVIATLHTPKRWNSRGSDKSTSSSDNDNGDDHDWTTADATTTPASSFISPEDEEAHELAIMSATLDSLGWKKVFIDARKLMPKIPIPKAATSIPKAASSAFSRFTFSSSSSSLDAGGADQSSSEATDDGENNSSGRVSSALMSTSPAPSTDSNSKNDDDTTTATATATSSNALTGDDEPRRVEAIARLKEKGGVVGSKDVAEAVLGPALFDEQFFHWPLGHNMMVAFSRNRLSTYMNKAGRPVVDSLARELVKDIFDWKPPPASSLSEQTSAKSTASNNGNHVPSEDMAATTT